MKKKKSEKAKPTRKEVKPMIKVDASTRGGGVVEPGFYTFKVTNFKKVDSKSSEGQNAVLTAIVTKADNDDLLGSRIIDNFPLQEATVWRIDLFYQACMGEPIEEGDYSEDDIFELLTTTIGAEFSAEAIVDTWQGQKRNRLQNFSA